MLDSYRLKPPRWPSIRMCRGAPETRKVHNRRSPTRLPPLGPFLPPQGARGSSLREGRPSIRYLEEGRTLTSLPSPRR